MEVDSGSSFEMPNGKQKANKSDEASPSQKSGENPSNESFIEDAIEIISATSPNFRNGLS